MSRIHAAKVFRIAALIALLFGQGAAAQVSLDGLLGGTANTAKTDPPASAADPAPTPAEKAAEVVALNDAQAALAAAVPDLTDWESRAAAAEALVLSGTASALALSRTRNTLFTWRDTFQSIGTLNAGRISTVQAQIDALGTPAEGAKEPAGIAGRRSELESELANLKAPALLAKEAYARANGLIAEVDSQIRAREGARLIRRGPSPLNPTNWPDAIAAGRESLGGVLAGATARLRSGVATGRLNASLPLGLVYLVSALVLLVWSRRWVSFLQIRVEASHARGRAIWSFLVSLGQIALPMLGLTGMILGFRQIGILAQDGDTFSSAIYTAGMVIIIARWLNGQLFPKDAGGGPLSYPQDVVLQIRRTGVALGVGLAAIVVVDALVRGVTASDATINAAILPLQIVIAIVLYRMGRLLRQSPRQTSGSASATGRVRRIVGGVYMLIAIIAPILSALGFAAASAALFVPAVMTLSIIGVFIVLRKLVYDIYAPSTNTEDAGPLMPVVIGFALFVVAMPVLALVWGARAADLLEIWARFRAGFQIGETTISPTDFLIFVMIFASGYLATRFLQGTLKATVLPRTKLDLGGQNAVVAGVGYIGIILAALIAITTAGINLSSLAIVAGALSVGIGFGLQTIVQNFVSGIILLIERPIGEGDMIEVNGQVGFVRDISVRSTRIETFDRTDVIIPNADLVSGQVTNWTRGNLVGRLILPVGVAYGSDVDEVRKILLDVGESHPMVLADPGPQALFMAFGASSLDFELRVILRDVNWKIVATNEMNTEISRRFAAAGIEIPFAQTDIWLRNPETLRTPPKPARKGKEKSPAGPQTAKEASALMGSSDLHDDTDADPDGEST